MKSADAILLTAIAVLLVLLVAWYSRRRDRYCAGPKNLSLYDRPYHNYPTYEGRGATWWDGDRRCAAYCGQSPCAVWCR